MQNDNIKKLISYLDLPNNDYWYDEASCIARDIIDSNLNIILETLLNQWENWSAERQEHLAYILGESDSKLEIKLLKAMSKSKDSDVVYRAKEALQNYKNT
ncbi:MAG: hypothetical protein GY749_13735 [Desulfobacteraceae bacterium]|nr:hypothetical protein [Desulfobacteraceae bacterium]